MATTKKISELDELTEPADDDEIEILDKSDTSTAETGKNKRISKANLVASAPPAAHAAEHENGGGDEIDVTGLSGLLADPQTPLPPDIIDETGAPVTLDSSHNGNVVLVDDDVTVPGGLGAGFSVMLIQTGASPVEIIASSTTVNNRQGHVHIADQFGVVTLFAYAANTFVLGGDTAT